MNVRNPFDPFPTEEGEYMARLDPFNKPINNRRYFANGKWSGPYFKYDRPEEKAKAREETSQFLLYWTEIPKE